MRARLPARMNNLAIKLSHSRKLPDLNLKKMIRLLHIMTKMSKSLTRTNQFLYPTISRETVAKERPNATSASQ